MVGTQHPEEPFMHDWETNESLNIVPSGLRPILCGIQCRYRRDKSSGRDVSKKVEFGKSWKKEKKNKWKKKKSKELM